MTTQSNAHGHAKSDNQLNETLRNNRKRPDDGNAFIPDPGNGAAHTNVDIAEEMAEDFIAGATSNDDAASNLRERVYDEEMGGPFVEESSTVQFAEGTDEANPPSATREPFPTAMRVPT